MNKKVSILGCGWLGLPLGERLVSHSYLVKGSTTSPSKKEVLKEKGIVPHLVDIESIDEADAPFFDSDILVFDVPTKNTEAVKKLVNKLEQSPVKHVIYTSSTSVYPKSNEVVTEDHPIREESALVAVEKMFLEAQSFSSTIVRFAGLLGPGRHPGRFFKNGRKIPDPEGFINMIHLEDCISIIQKIMESNTWGNVFNGCADSHPKRRDFYTRMFSLLNREPPQFIESEESEFKIVSNEKLKKELNYTFIYPDPMHFNFELDSK